MGSWQKNCGKNETFALDLKNFHAQASPYLYMCINVPIIFLRVYIDGDNLSRNRNCEVDLKDFLMVSFGLVHLMVPKDWTRARYITDKKLFV